jgi:hemoglobin
MSSANPSSNAPTPFDRVGGAPAVEALVDRFYQLILADAALVEFFEGMDVNRIKAHQRALISQLLGGPQAYGGRELAAAHEALEIRKADYDLVVGHLVAACRELGVPEDIIAQVGEALAAVEPAIVAPVGG